MYNDLLKIGPFTVHGYGLMIAIGLFSALYLAEWRASKNGLDKEFVWPLTIYCAVTGILGAKIMFCIVEWREFIKNPLALLGSSGLVVYGGIIGGVLSAIFYCRYKKLPFMDCFDLAMPSVAVAQGFGRIGCFLAGCCYGRETNAWYGIAFSHSNYAPNGTKMIPTQLISSAGMFAIAGILCRYAYRAKKPGQVGGLYMILYSIGRFGVEFLRNDHRGAIGIFSTSQFISFFILTAGVIIMICCGRSEKNRPQACR